MSDLKLILFGTPHVEFQNQTIENVSPQAIALAAHIALANQPQSPAVLAALLFPQQKKAHALIALLQCLDQLKSLSDSAWLDIQTSTVTLIPDAITIDVQEFLSALTGTHAHLHTDGRLCDDCAASLNAAVAFYRGDFLAGFGLSDNSVFEDWQTKQREWLKRDCLHALRRLAEHSAATGALDQAIGYAQRWLAVNALDESAHRLLMRLYAINNQRADALRQYETCARSLDDALTTPPESETKDLYDLIRSGQIPPLLIGTQQGSTEVFASVSVLPPAPSLVVGREEALHEIKSRLGISSTETKHPVTVIEGWPGVGKSTIIGALAHDADLRRAFPDGILWTFLGETPNVLSHLIEWGEALHLVAPGKTPMLEDLSKQIAAALHDRRVLLIVDDVWQVDHAAPFCLNGENGGLLITSRLSDVAHALAPTPSDVYRLPVLSDDYALSLLKQLASEAVDEHPAEALELIHHLEGLPLAIQVAGRLLREETSMGRGITDLLYQLSEGNDFLAAQSPDDMTSVKGHTAPTVAALFKRSTDSLDEETLVRFALLSLFVPKPATFDLPALASVWAVDDPRPTVRLLVNRGLIEPISSGRFQLHAMLVLHSKSLLKNVR